MLSALLLEILASVFIPQLSSIFFIVCTASADLNAVYHNAFVNRDDKAGSAIDSIGHDHVSVVRINRNLYLRCRHFELVGFHQVYRIEDRLVAKFAVAGFMENRNFFVGNAIAF